MVGPVLLGSAEISGQLAIVGVRGTDHAGKVMYAAVGLRKEGNRYVVARASFGCYDGPGGLAIGLPLSSHPGVVVVLGARQAGVVAIGHEIPVKAASGEMQAWVDDKMEDELEVVPLGAPASTRYACDT
jgi:hypothetical protein